MAEKSPAQVALDKLAKKLKQEQERKEQAEKLKEKEIYRLPPRNPPPLGPVVGQPTWDPIDKTAARVISKTPWWAHPPDIKPTKNDEQKILDQELKKADEKKRNKANRARESLLSLSKRLMAQEQHSYLGGNPAFKQVQGSKEQLIDMRELIPQLASKIVKTSKKVNPLMSESAEKVAECGVVLEQAVQLYARHVETFEHEAKRSMERLRSVRVATVNELSTTTKALEDIRKFLLSSHHEEEIRRLQEFVSLCERLQALKNSGFLDTVADTILKLS